MKNIFICLMALGLSSCFQNNEGQGDDKNIKCDSFESKDGIVIISEKEIKEPVLAIRYERGSDFQKGLDTLKFSLYKSKFDNKTGYGASNPDKVINTAFDYKIIINDFIEFKITDFTSRLFSFGGDFMSGKQYMCGITSYKVDGEIFGDEKGANRNIKIVVE